MMIFLNGIQGELIKPVGYGDQVHPLIVDIANTLGISIRGAKEETIQSET
jgi:hypothetical protein